MPSSWALERAEALLKRCTHLGRRSLYAHEIAAEFDRIVRETAEECARIADSHIEHGEFWHDGRYDCAEYIVREIRARFPAQAKEEG